MNESEALASFLALSQAPRLRVVRLLVEAEPAGLPAGRISAALGCTPSNASFHLAHLERAGLVRARREGRSIVYRAAVERIRGLAGYLMTDCCGGRPDLCASPFPLPEAYPCRGSEREAAEA